MFHQHRQRFLERLGQENAAALIATGSLKVRCHDTHHRFRPASDFWYLTGFREPDAVLLLVPNHAEARSVLFLNERDPAAETWNGRRLGTAAAPGALGVDRAHPIGELETRLAEYLPGHERLVARLGDDGERDRRWIEAVQTAARSARGGRACPREWVDPAATLHELRLVKDAGELALMRRAAAISGEAHRAVMRAARAGRNEGELDALLDYTFRRHGGTGSAYTNIVAGGANACILHYVENDRPLKDGELLLVDAGCEWEYYASDVTRTFPVSGRFNAEQRALYEVVLAAQARAIDRVRPGSTMEDVHQAALEVLVDGLIGLGLLTGSRQAALDEQTYRRFYMHRTGHWLGLDVHDAGATWRAGAPRPFEPGMVTTVEPGLYVDSEDQTVEARWRGIGIRIEDDVLVTASGHEVLTDDVPRSIAEVEEACQAEDLAAAGRSEA
jgi:Xaa-Pro aminopeptidase